MKEKILLFVGTEQYDTAMKIINDNKGSIVSNNGIRFANTNERVDSGFSKKSMNDATMMIRRNKVRDRLRRKLANRTMSSELL